MAELNDIQQKLYDKIISGLNLLADEYPLTVKLIIQDLDTLVEDLLNKWNNLR